MCACIHVNMCMCIMYVVILTDVLFVKEKYEFALCVILFNI